MRWVLFWVILAAWQPGAWAQTLTGRVVQARKPLSVGIPFAGVQQLGHQHGVLTDSLGRFSLPLAAPGPFRVIFSAEGYLSDTLVCQPGAEITVALEPVTSIEGVEVSRRRQASFQQSLAPQQSELLTSAEFTKAACCNLGESFETNPSVDVNYSDAISGAKSITLLGLNGVYTNLLVEGIPWYNGLGRTYGLNYIPGPWLSSVQISKGTGPAVLGYETVTGQINLAMKSAEDERLVANLFVNEFGRTELNLTHHQKWGEQWQLSTLLHGSTVPTVVDRNNDGFLDTPLSDQGNVFLRVRYRGVSGFEGQLAMQALREDRRAGQTQVYQSNDPALSASGYRLDVQTTRLAYFSKTGYVWQARPYQSIGLQTSGLYHDANGVFGLKTWQGIQRRWTGNLIFQSALGDTRHTYRVGMSYLFDAYEELYNGLDVGRRESVPGTFAEYTFAPNMAFTAVVGVRADFHNRFGTFVSPRLNLRYQVSDGTTVRLAAGRGFRSANPFADNSPTLTSNRVVLQDPELRPEVGWNTGASLTHNFELFFRPGTLTLDYYYTWFQNQILADYDQNPQAIYIQNLQGRSRGHSFQAELSWQPLKLLDAKIAYKYYNVQATFAGTLQQVMLTPEHRGLVNLAYRLRAWRFDYTLKLLGTQRLHSFAEHHSGFELQEMAPAYTLSDAQVTLLPAERWEVYLGAENLFDYRQPDPIIDAANPFGPFFDTSYVWGPILGRVVYLGLRYTIPKAS